MSVIYSSKCRTETWLSKHAGASNSQGIRMAVRMVRIFATLTLIRLCSRTRLWSTGELCLKPYLSGPETALSGGGPGRLCTLEKVPHSGLAVQATNSPARVSRSMALNVMLSARSPCGPLAISKLRHLSPLHSNRLCIERGRMFGPPQNCRIVRPKPGPMSELLVVTGAAATA